MGVGRPHILPSSLILLRNHGVAGASGPSLRSELFIGPAAVLRLQAVRTSWKYYPWQFASWRCFEAGHKNPSRLLFRPPSFGGTAGIVQASHLFNCVDEANHKPPPFAV
ncbi:hypothetical protein LX32DRAFT_171498 [Colletotrichum zoysiae]|uniref:Uncharacterized protein n=1 Tax=Colletotrichum zoysiae TaxID=1216348 RepID=A0AAD9H651_9PEZI|nr:hypothetical protein LX32DRAFT_171498 [Colletotrichum zoysiae]